jgi:predicted RecB family nuclease
MPVRFVFSNKIANDDKLMLAFNALVFSEGFGCPVTMGKIVHSENYTVRKVKLSDLIPEVRKLIEKIRSQFSSESPPDLVLNRHCVECEFQARCRKKAIEKDDLSLLSGMSFKERRTLHGKGVFTINQLSYTFRPRRRPKQLRDKREKYHHSLKALALREKRIFVVGNSEFKIEGTPVYLDVEGVPDRDFYYLIGLRIGCSQFPRIHNLWADTVDDERRIWQAFLDILETVDRPVIVHYGSYESNFFERMKARYGLPKDGSISDCALKGAINLITVMFAKAYFPTFSNGLKDIAGWLGHVWKGEGFLACTHYRFVTNGSVPAKTP